MYVYGLNIWVCQGVFDAKPRLLTLISFHQYFSCFSHASKLIIRCTNRTYAGSGLSFCGYDDSIILKKLTELNVYYADMLEQPVD